MSQHQDLTNFPIGLGCMNLAHGYNQPVSLDEGISLIRGAFELGYRHFDTATLYGGGYSEQVVGAAIQPFRDEIFLASKAGLCIDPEHGRQLDARPNTLKRQCEASLERLNTEQIDLYYLHRIDPDVPIEESVGALGDLIDQGKIASYGLSEVSAVSIQRAHRERAVSAVQSEYSVWTRNPEIAVLDLCQDCRIQFVAFSPLGRGSLSETLDERPQFSEADIRRTMPRFQPENWGRNLELIKRFSEIARELGCTSAQLALAWIRSRRPEVVSIPGSRNLAHMRENLDALSLMLSDRVLERIEQVINRQSVSGARYSDAQQSEIDTEEFQL